MAKRLLSIFSVLLLCTIVAGCSRGPGFSSMKDSEEETIGDIEGIEFSSDLFRYEQYLAYEAALSYSNDLQKELSFQDFLKETITINGENLVPNGDYVVNDYMNERAMAQLNYYAAIEITFKEMKGELSEDELTKQYEYADKAFKDNEDIYTANGINYETVKMYYCNLSRANELLKMFYGTEGTNPVSDRELLDYMDKALYFGEVVKFPFYNPELLYTNLAKEKNEVASYAAELADVINSGSDFTEAVKSYLPVIYQVAGVDDYEFINDDIEIMLLSSSVIESLYGKDVLMNFEASQKNKANYMSLTDNAGIIFLRLDPIESGAYTLDQLKSSVLIQLKYDDMVASLLKRSKGYKNHLSESKLDKYGVDKLVLINKDNSNE